MFVVGMIVGAAFMRPGAAPVVVKLDLNRATLEEIRLLPGVGDSLSRRIAERRPFHSVEDLQHVPGIGPKTLAQLKPYLVVNESTGKKANQSGEPIDVNIASLEELQRLPGIGPVKSQAIIEERSKKAFANVADLRRVKGIGPKTLEHIRPFVTVGKPTQVAAQ